MLKSALESVNNFLERISGLRIQPSSESRLSASRSKILNLQSISLVVDVGANSGQWAKRIRRDGYQGEIWSFEPTNKFSELKNNSSADEKWKVFNLALGNEEGEREMFLSSNDGLSSSLLEPSGIRDHHPSIEFHTKLKVNVSTLDIQLNQNHSPFYLKIDTQGGEELVLNGGHKALERCLAIEFESALVPLYKNEILHYQLASKLLNLGFSPAQVAVTHWDSDLGTVSLDSIFVRESL
jgi:FkbM family methyltransferase